MTEKRVLIFWGVVAALIFFWNTGDWFKPIFSHWFYLEVTKWQRGFGALFGLGVILLGAMYNAKLNRERDDRIREEEQRSIAAAFSAEIESIIRQDRHAESALEKAIKRADEIGVEMVSSMGLKLLSLSKDRTIYNELSAQLGKLDPQVARQVTVFYRYNLRAQMVTDRLVNTDAPVSLTIANSALITVQKAIKSGDRLSTRLLEFAETGVMPKSKSSDLSLNAK